MTPGRVLYRRRSYDFDDSLLAGLDVSRASFVGTVAAILRGDYDLLELNEPTMVGIWPRLVMYCAAFRVARHMRGVGAHPRCVLYAIDNFDVRTGVARYKPGLAPVTTRVFDLVFPYLLGTFSRVAFGTQGAWENYAELSRGKVAITDSTVLTELRAVCPCTDLEAKRDGVLFVGNLDDRKGIKQLMAVWPLIKVASPQLALVIVGKGRLREQVEGWCTPRPEVTFISDPPRSVIHEQYRRAGAVVLLSQPRATWREQVGLPLVEGLAHGCEIVTTSETGIADWLRGHGHQVVEAADPPRRVVDAVCRAVGSGRSRAEIVASLPVEDVRVTADLWLMR